MLAVIALFNWPYDIVSKGLSFFCNQSFNDYCSAEHERFLSLSREMVDFRRLFSEMKAATEKELTCVRTDVANATRKMQSSCLNFNVDEQDGKMQDQVIFGV